MSGYVPHTAADVAAMLEAIGVGTVEDLFAHVPASLRQRAQVGLPDGVTESELRGRLAALAARSRSFGDTPVFLGAGAYPHAVPAVVDQILLRSEFATAYTPYQPEVSQGTLQAIFEFQTFAATLLGLDVANASVYDGASATAEAVLMARRIKPSRRVVLLARSLHPHYRATVATYLRSVAGIEIREVPFDAEGCVDPRALGTMLDDDTVCVVVGYPNVLGVVEDIEELSTRVHDRGALFITATAEALALGAIRSPGAGGTDIAVAEGQSFGLPMSYGGPGVGLFAARDEYVRSLPGRLVGETVDGEGRRGFVLTLAAREQHIRRERATSNICTNQGLCALAVTVFLSLLGRNGLRELAQVNLDAAHAALSRLTASGARRLAPGPFFNEFVIEAPGIASRWEDVVKTSGIVPGFPLGRWYPELPNGLLVCVTELHDEPQLERLVEVVARGARS